MSRLTGDDLLWNWARWCWSGETVGNMHPHISEDDVRTAVNIDHARIVDQMHAALPWHERMVIIAEYPQKNALFGDLDARSRITRARAWIEDTTGVAISDTEYRIYLGMFKNAVQRRLA